MISANEFHAWFQTFVNRCQIVAGLPVSENSALLPEIRRWFDKIPQSAHPFELTVVRVVAARTAWRLINASSTHEPPLEPFALFTMSNEGCREVDTEWRRCIDALARSHLSSRPSASSPRVVLALRTIADRYANPRLRLIDVAAHVNLSSSRLSRLLREEAGATFLTLVHRERLTAAKVLLQKSPKSIKEIASAVGYQSTTELDRHFKGAMGVTPSEFRTRYGTIV